MEEKKINMVEPVECGCELYSDEADFHIIEPFVDINYSNLSDVKFNKEEFQRGVDDMSYFCGKLNALLMMNIPIELALSSVVELSTTDIVSQNNYCVAKLQADSNTALASVTKQNEAKAEI